MSQHQQVRLFCCLSLLLCLAVGCRWWLNLGVRHDDPVWIGAPLVSTAQAAKAFESTDNTPPPLAEAADDDAATPPEALDLNTADEQELQSLPGIGPVLARSIIDERTRRGGFAAVEDLLDVKGIGPARYARIAPLVCVVAPEP